MKKIGSYRTVRSLRLILNSHAVDLLEHLNIPLTFNVADSLEFHLDIPLYPDSNLRSRFSPVRDTNVAIIIRVSKTFTPRQVQMY